MINKKYQNMDIDRWSQNSDAFKTISSGSETRNQTTTNKKGQLKSRASPKLAQKNRLNVQDMEQTLKQLYCRRQEYLESRQKDNGIKRKASHKKQKKVLLISKQIEKIQNQLLKQREVIINKTKQNEQLQIYEAHRKQVQRFKQIWEGIFEDLRRKQQIMRIHLDVQKQRDIRQAVEKVWHKQEEIRKKTRTCKELKEIQRIQQNLIKNGHYEQLSRMNFQKRRKQIKERLKSERKQLVSQLKNVQKQKIKRKYLKKQESMEQKLNECRDQQYKIYKKYESILKKKFINALNKLQHIHTVTLNLTFKNNPYKSKQSLLRIQRKCQSAHR